MSALPWESVPLPVWDAIQQNRVDSMERHWKGSARAGIEALWVEGITSQHREMREWVQAHVTPSQSQWSRAMGEIFKLPPVLDTPAWATFISQKAQSFWVMSPFDTFRLFYHAIDVGQKTFSAQLRVLDDDSYLSALEDLLAQGRLSSLEGVLEHSTQALHTVTNWFDGEPLKMGPRGQHRVLMNPRFLSVLATLDFPMERACATVKGDSIRQWASAYAQVVLEREVPTTHERTRNPRL